MSVKSLKVLELVNRETGYTLEDLENVLESLSPAPLVPRITKSTAVATIKARFENDGEILERFEIAKEQANLWDGERDGLREVVKKINPGSFIAPSGSTVILSRTETAKVLYPNAAGKHQLENCLQTTIPEITGVPQGTGVIAFMFPETTLDNPDAFLDAILHQLQKGKDVAQAFLLEAYIGQGEIVDNAELYEKKGSEKSAIAVIPNDK